MSVKAAYRDQIHEAFQALDSDELVQRLRTGSLTEAAKETALAELTSRGVSTADLDITPSAVAFGPPPADFFVRCFTGTERLWKAYWLLGVLVGGVLSIPMLLFASTGSKVGVLLWYVVVIVPFQIFWSISVWRCAFRSSTWVWAMAARALVVLIAVYIVVSWIRV